MKYLFVPILIITVLFDNSVFGQCSVEIVPSKNEVYCGDRVDLNLNYIGSKRYVNDFNECQIGDGWSTSFTPQFNVPCVTSQDGSCFLWTDTITNQDRYIESPTIPLTDSDVRLHFDMMYGVQSGIPSYCEGIDLPDEGVYVEYRINANPWQPLKYYDPKGGYDTLLTNWNTYILDVPISGFDEWQVIKFRWIQLEKSYKTHDHWGLDNIIVEILDANAYAKWRHLSDSTSLDITEHPTESSWYHVTYFDGTNYCVDSTYIQSKKLEADILVSTNDSICLGDEVSLTIKNSYTDSRIDYCGIAENACNYWQDNKDIKLTSDSLRTTNYHFEKPHIFGAVFDAQQRTQVIIQANDLHAINFDNGVIHGLSLYINDIGFNRISSITEFFYVKMGCTTQNEFDATHEWIEGLTEVGFYNNRVLWPRWNKFDFDVPYAWDGASNLVLEFCEYTYKDSAWNSTESNDIGTKDHYVDYSTTLHKFNMESNGSCDFEERTLFDIFTSKLRPEIDFHVCQPKEIEMVYNWETDSTLNTDTIYNPVATPLHNQSYKVTYNGAGFPEICGVTDSVNIVVFQPNETLQIDTVICKGDSLLINDVYVDSAGLYSDTIANNAGCDFIVNYDISVVDRPDINVLAIGYSLFAMQDNAQYQWYDCETDSIIEGAINQQYKPTKNGLYGVLVTMGGCTASSNCHDVWLTGINKGNSIGAINLFPNPVKGGKLTIDNNSQSNAMLIVYTLLGQFVFEQSVEANTKQTLQLELVLGTYMYEIDNGTNKVIGKLVVQ
jgi:hypothetical protein